MFMLFVLAGAFISLCTWWPFSNPPIYVDLET
jgi:hypothetical protein